MKRIFATLILLAATAPAWAETWYQVNLVVFENPGSASSGELLAAAPDRTVEYPPKMVEVADVQGADDLAQSLGFQNAEITDKDFSAALANLQRSNHYRVLTVKSWRQPAMGRDEALAVRVTGGNKYGVHYRLDGSVRLITSQTLHLETNLWLGDYAAQPGSAPAPAHEFSAGDIDDQMEPAIDAEYVATRLINTHDSRAMNSGELHYLDHPVMGVLVKVVRLKNVEE